MLGFFLNILDSWQKNISLPDAKNTHYLSPTFRFMIIGCAMVILVRIVTNLPRLAPQVNIDAHEPRIKITFGINSIYFSHRRN